jgi:hypothetical protein
MYLDGHKGDGNVLAGLAVLVEGGIGDEKEGYEESQDEEVLDTEESLVDHHGYPVAEEHEDEHEAEETEETERNSEDGGGTDAFELTGWGEKYPPEDEGQLIQVKCLRNPSHLLMKKRMAMAGMVKMTTMNK